MRRYVLLILSLLLLLNMHAQVGTVDPTFATNGIRLFLVPNITSNVLKVLPAPGHQQYVIYYTGTTQQPEVVIAKYSSSGSPDPAYGNNGYSNPLVMQFADAALQNDGKIVLAGSTYFGVYPDFHDDLLVARYTVNGTLDTSFNQTGVKTKTYSPTTYEFTRSVTVSAQHIAVGGYSVSLPGGFAFFHVNVFDGTGASTGSMITSDAILLQRFAPANYNHAIAIQGNKIIAAITQPDFTGAGNFFSLKRFFIDGSPDNSFGQQGVTTLGNDFIRGAAVTTFQGNKILVGTHSYDAATDQYGFALARYNNDGSADNSFNGNGRQVTNLGAGTPAAPTVILTQGDTIYVAGNLYNPATGMVNFALARYNNNGSLDIHFDTNGKQTTGMSDRSLSPSNMLVLGNRLLVTGLANSSISGIAGVAVQYMLEDAAPVALACHADTVLLTATGDCAVIVNGIDPVTTAINLPAIQYILSGATTATGQGTASGLNFNKGITQVTYTVIATPLITCSFLVTVKDKEAPIITTVATNPTYLWPADHRMVDIPVSYTATDNCGAVSTALTVTSSEADGKLDKDDIKGDWQIVNNHLVKLRAERYSRGYGRVYTIQITAADAAGNTTTSNITINVPHYGHGGLADIPGIPYRRDAGEEATGPLRVKTLSNPSTSYFTLQTSSVNSKEKLSLRVINQLGIVMETRTNVPPNGTLQLGQVYRDGIYIAELVQGKERVQVKLVKLK